ncbi:MAG: DMT family transporter [Anaerolineae bacterium]
MSRRPHPPPILIMTIGVFAISFSAIFIRWAQVETVPSLVIATWRTGLAAVFLLPFALAGRRRELAGLTAVDWGLALLSGGMLGIHFGTWISSLAYTTVTSSLVLVATSPLWVGLASPLVLKEPLSRSLKLGLLMAMVGSVIIGMSELVSIVDGRVVLNLGQLAGASRPLLGDGLALLGAVTAAVYLIIGRRLRKKLSLLSYTTVVYGVAAVTLLLTSLLRGLDLIGYTPRVYLLFLLMALFPQLIGHSSFNWVLGFLPAAYVAVVVISEPIGASILAMFFFREFPGPVVILGGALILAGIVKVSRPDNVPTESG